MASVTLNRADTFPVGTSVGLYAASSRSPVGGAATGSAVSTATVDAAGVLTFTGTGITDYTAYTAYAQVAGAHRYLSARSTSTGFQPTAQATPWRDRVRVRRGG